MQTKLDTPLRVRKVRRSGAVHFKLAGGAIGGVPHFISIAPVTSVRSMICGGEQPVTDGVGAGGGVGVGGFGICEGPPVTGRAGVGGGVAVGGLGIWLGPPVTGGTGGAGCAGNDDPIGGIGDIGGITEPALATPVSPIMSS